MRRRISHAFGLNAHWIRPAVLLCSAAVPLAAATESRGQLSGVVRDDSGAVLIEAGISIVNQETGIRRGVRSAPDGTYAVAGLAAGLYKLTVRKPGFQTLARQNVGLNPGESLRVDFVMRIGSMREVVTIEGRPAMLNTEDGSVGTLVERHMIEELPLNGRGIMGLLDLAAGVVVTPASAGEAGQFSSAGHRPNTNYFTVDGVSANTGVSGGGMPAQFSGGTLPGMTAFGSTQNLVSVYALEEVRVQTSSFAPQFGRMPGAHIALTTRAGSNEYHGSLFYNFRHEKPDANDWFANSRNLARMPLRLNHPGGTLGGPLVRDRTFFFASLERMRLKQPYTWQGLVPSLETRRAAPADSRGLLNAFPLPSGPEMGRGAALFTARTSLPSAMTSGSLRVDHALTDRTTLFGRFSDTPSSTELGYSFLENSRFRSRSVTVAITSSLGPRLTNDVRINVSGSSATSGWVTTGNGGARPADLGSYFPPRSWNGAAFYGIEIGGLGRLVSGTSGRNRQGQLNIVETAAWTTPAHSLRFGADYQRLTPARESDALSAAGVYRSLSDVLAGEQMLVTFAEADQASSLIETLSLFAQDTWRPSSRLALTFGARWEFTPAPAVRRLRPVSSIELTPLPGGPVITRPPSGPPDSAVVSWPLRPGAGTGGSADVLSFLPSAPTEARLWPTRYSQFAPRIGAAFRWKPGSIVRAGWGIFYDLGFSAATDPINGFPFNRWQFQAGPVTTLRTLYGERFAPGLRLPYSQHWNVALEQSLSASDAVSVSYVGAAGRNLLRREGLAHPETGLAQIVVATNEGRSDYHGLQWQYRRRMSAGLQGVVSYTWAHSLDNGSWDSALALVQPGTAASADRGSSSFDIRHSLSAAFSYDVPSPSGNGVPARAGRGWRLSGTARLRSGFPIDVLMAENLLGLGFDNAPRPDLNPGVPVWIEDRFTPGGRRLNPEAFSAPAGGWQGGLGRNSIRGFGMRQVDLAVQRDFAISESAALTFRVEAFNALNQANFGDPVRYLNSPLFGQPASLLNLMLGSGSPRGGLTPAFQMGGPRSFQWMLRLRF